MLTNTEKMTIYDIDSETDLPKIYSEELNLIENGEEFQNFLIRWEEFLDNKVKNFKSEDWTRLKKLIDMCRPEAQQTENCQAEEVYELIVPSKFLGPSLVSAEFGIPWAEAFYHLQRLGLELHNKNEMN